jgi:hypothetical protein
MFRQDWCVAASIALVAACGGTPAQQSNNGGSPNNGGPAQHALTVTVTGAGTVASTPAGIACGASCSASFPQGTSVSLSANAAAGSVFAGWDGGCSGQGACAVTLNSDLTIAARFIAIPPPPPNSFKLTVSTQGKGSVRSTPAGIDCGQTCSASFGAGTQVQLTPLPEAGWEFSGWTASCLPAPMASGSHDCFVDLSKDQTATATFTQGPPPPPPPPADECAGLMPGALPTAVVARLPQNSCLDATSDDGTGNYLLGYTAGVGPNYPNYLFFTIQDGKAVRIGDVVPGGDESATFIFSQPSGFTSFHLNGPSGGSSLISYSHEGKRTSEQAVAKPNSPHFPSSAAGIDPSGGTAIARQQYLNNGWVTTYQRLDKTGAPETGETAIDDQEHPLAGVGVALSGHALVVEYVTAGVDGGLRGRWLARDGTPLTAWFTLESAHFPVLRFLMDGSIAVGAGPQFSGVGWKYLVPDSQTTAAPLPTWMQERPTNPYFVIRNGRGYASWGQGGQCGMKSLEVLATSGKSCGCVSPPNAQGFNVGRDGSMIVSEPPANFGTCTFDLYPQLLK